MDDSRSPSPLEAKEPAQRPSSRWRFRLGLLELLGLMTVACLAAAAVMAMPEEPRADRLFVAIAIGGAALGILLGRGFAGSGMILAPMGAALTAGGATWFFPADSLYDPFADSSFPLGDGSLLTIGISSLLAAVIGFYVALFYAAAIWLVRNGPRATIALCRDRPVRCAAAVLLPLAPFVAAFVFHKMQVGGPKPLVNLELGFSASEIVVSATGNCWAVRETTGFGLQNGGPWRLFSLRERDLRQIREIGDELSGEIAIAPSGKHIAHVSPDGETVIRALPSGEVVYAVDPTKGRSRERIWNVYWASDGRLATQGVTAKGWTIGIWQFDGKSLIREAVFAGPRFPVVIGRNLDWVARIEGDSENSEVFIERIADGQVSSYIMPTAAEFDPDAWSNDAKYLVLNQALYRVGETEIDERDERTYYDFTNNDLVLAVDEPYRWLNPILERGDPFAAYSYVPLESCLYRLTDFRQVLLVDPKTRRAVAQLRAIKERIHDVAVSADGSKIG